MQLEAEPAVSGGGRPRGDGGHCLRLIRAVESIASPGSLSPGLMGTMIVMVLCALGQDLPQVLFTVDQQMVKALAP